MAVTLAPFAHEDRKAMSVAIALALPAQGEAPKTLQTIVSIFDADGKALGSQRRDVQLGAGLGSGGEEVLVLSRLDLPHGAYHVRFSAHDLQEDKTGSVYADVAAPDFAAPLSLSGVVLHDRTAIVASPSAALAALLPVTPTTRRAFATSADVDAFVRVYQGGAGALVPITMRVTIVDGHDRLAFSREDTLGPERFSPRRAADFLFQLPLTRLSPGPYLLQLTAQTTGGNTAQQQVRITVH